MADESRVGANNPDSRSLALKTVRPVTFKFEDVVYKVKLMPSTSWTDMFKKKAGDQAERTILKGITGVVKPGELLAMMGPSGCGKTTLLTALGGRLGGKITGSITYNARPFSKSVKRNIGFVTQDDVLHPHLTVTETLVFTALLRLPRSMSMEEKVQHVESIIVQLGLVTCRNSIIGGEIIRGVSGGERKRVSVGQEMLINPSLLFLDEPTSGLDSTTAQRTVSTLADLARGGRTIITTIHQPSSRLYSLFHKVMLLSDGNPIYFGNASTALDYFSSIGYEPNVLMNPSDFLLDLANGIASEDSVTDQKAVKQALVAAYVEHLDAGVRREAHVVEEAENEESRKERKSSEQFQSTWTDQFMVIFRRSLKERKHESFSGLRVFQVVISALLAGLLWFRSSPNNIQDKTGLLFFSTGFWSFYPLFKALFTFPEERRMLVKERTSGMYRLSSYFMAQIAADLPMEFVIPTVFVIIIYWMGGLHPSAGAFFATLFTILFAVLVEQGLGLMLGALVMDVKTATTLGSVILLGFMLAGGFYVQNVPIFIRWIKYISVIHYVFKLLLRTQYSPNQTYECSPGVTCRVEDQAVIKATGLDYLAVTIIILVLMLVIFRLIAYLSLMRIGKTKSA